jgi:hypothetical protein
MYVDDLKVVGEMEEKLRKQLQIFKPVNVEILMESGPVKCENVAFKMENFST